MNSTTESEKFPKCLKIIFKNLICLKKLLNKAQILI